MISALTFTCPRDFREAVKSSQSLPTDWLKTWIVETKHAEAVAPFAEKANASIVIDDFNRGASLRGIEAVHGVIRNIARLFENPDCTCVVKIDSDCVLWQPSELTEPILHGGFSLVGVSHGSTRKHVSGACYAISRTASRVLRNTCDHALLQIIAENAGHEDRSIADTLFFAGLPILAYPQTRMNLQSHKRQNDEQIFGHHF